MGRENRYWIPYRNRDTNVTGVQGPYQSWDKAKVARKTFIAENDQYFEVGIPISSPDKIEAERKASCMSGNA